MKKNELMELARLIEEKERDLTICRQAMMNFSAMLRDDTYKPAILEQASEQIDDLIGLVYNDIRKAMPRIKDEHWKDEQIKRLAAEVVELKNRTLWQRIRNKKNLCTNH